VRLPAQTRAEAEKLCARPQAIGGACVVLKKLKTLKTPTQFRLKVGQGGARSVLPPDSAGASKPGYCHATDRAPQITYSVSTAKMPASTPS
jgi:hypothetical protein